VLNPAGKEYSFDIMKDSEIHPQREEIKSYEFVCDAPKHPVRLSAFGGC